VARLPHCISLCWRTACVWLLVIVVGAGLAKGSDKPKEPIDSPQQPPLLRLLRESRTPHQAFATRFLQRKHLAILDADLESEGMIFFRRPGSVRYEILSPVRSLMTYDGKKVRCYAFSEGQWKLLNNPAATAIGQVLRQIGHWIQGDFEADRKMFDLTVVPAEDGGGCIHLTPRSEALAKYLQRVEIYVEKAPDYRVTRVLLRESDVDLTEMRFRQELRNPALPEGTFSSPEASGACQAIFPAESNCDPNNPEKPKS